jgi:two-component system sensor histidine kinase TctE
MSRSLRRQLLGPLAWVWLLGALAAGLGAYSLARYAGDRAYDRTLQDEAGAIATQINWTDRGPLLELSTQTQQILARDSADRNAFMVTDSEGRILAGVGDLPAPHHSEASFKSPILFDANYLGEPVRGAMYSIRSPMLDQFVSVVVVETKRKRSELVREIQLGVLLPTLALGLGTFVLLGLSIRRGVEPLNRVAGEVGSRDAHDLRPLALAGVPTEAVPLIERINALLAKVSRSVELQRRFVADAAHQLRTPVAGIRVLSQELQQELAAGASARDEEAVQALLKAMVDSTERMGRLVGQLLNLARSEAALAAGTQGERERVDVLPLIRQAAEPLVLRATSLGRHVSLEAPDVPCIARAHPVWLAEVVSNLLDNAIRHGGPTVEVRVNPSDQEVEIEVMDDGAGIPAHHQALIFEPFWRGERADLQGSEGAGLGLAIVKEIVQRMGGRIQVSSRPEVAGTRFTIALPA